MIINITSGSNVAGLVAYHESKVQKGLAERLGGINMIDPDDGEYIEKTLQSQRDYYCGTSEKTTHHASISFAKEDIGKLTDEILYTIACDHIKVQGLASQPCQIYKHLDKPDHPHIHVITVRTTDDGKLIPDFQERNKAQKFSRFTENNYGLINPLDRQENSVMESMKAILMEVLKMPNVVDLKSFKNELNSKGMDLAQVKSPNGEFGYKYFLLQNDKRIDKGIPGSKIDASLSYQMVQKAFEKSKKRISSPMVHKVQSREEITKKALDIFSRAHFINSFHQKLKLESNKTAQKRREIFEDVVWDHYKTKFHQKGEKITPGKAMSYFAEKYSDFRDLQNLLEKNSQEGSPSSATLSIREEPELKEKKLISLQLYEYPPDRLYDRALLFMAEVQANPEKLSAKEFSQMAEKYNLQIDFNRLGGKIYDYTIIDSIAHENIPSKNLPFGCSWEDLRYFIQDSEHLSGPLNQVFQKLMAAPFWTGSELLRELKPMGIGAIIENNIHGSIIGIRFLDLKDPSVHNGSQVLKNISWEKLMNHYLDPKYPEKILDPLITRVQEQLQTLNHPFKHDPNYQILSLQRYGINCKWIEGKPYFQIRNNKTFFRIDLLTKNGPWLEKMMRSPKLTPNLKRFLQSNSNYKHFNGLELELLEAYTKGDAKTIYEKALKTPRLELHPTERATHQQSLQLDLLSRDLKEKSRIVTHILEYVQSRNPGSRFFKDPTYITQLFNERGIGVLIQGEGHQMRITVYNRHEKTEIERLQYRNEFIHRFIEMTIMDKPKHFEDSQSTKLFLSRYDIKLIEPETSPTIQFHPINFNPSENEIKTIQNIENALNEYPSNSIQYFAEQWNATRRKLSDGTITNIGGEATYKYEEIPLRFTTIDLQKISPELSIQYERILFNQHQTALQKKAREIKDQYEKVLRPLFHRKANLVENNGAIALSNYTWVIGPEGKKSLTPLTNPQIVNPLQPLIMKEIEAYQNELPESRGQAFIDLWQNNRKFLPEIDYKNQLEFKPASSYEDFLNILTRQLNPPPGVHTKSILASLTSQEKYFGLPQFSDFSEHLENENGFIKNVTERQEKYIHACDCRDSVQIASLKLGGHRPYLEDDEHQYFVDNHNRSYKEGFGDFNLIPEKAADFFSDWLEEASKQPVEEVRNNGEEELKKARQIHQSWKNNSSATLKKSIGVRRW